MSGTPGRPLVAVDIDRTLIYSSAAVLMGEAAGWPAPDLVEVERYQGAAASFMTVRAAQLLSQLRDVADVVPVTTRTMAQFQRVQWPGGPVRYAVTTNGARILVDDVEDETWSSAVLARVAEGCASLEEIQARLATAGDWMLRLRDAEGLFSYAVVDRAQLPPDDLRELSDWAGQRNWVVSLQGSKLYCLPAPLTKSAAVSELAARLGSGTTFAAGDSLLDADVLTWAQHAIRPAHGELHTAKWTPPGLTVTDAVGARAGEELLDWLLASVTQQTTAS